MDMSKRIIILLVLCATSISMNAQKTVYLTENEKDIYWQPNTKINFSHYQALTDTACVKFYNKYGLTMASNIGIRGVVDVPNKKRKLDKSYVAPVFCKNCSCILSEDTLILKVDQLLFDFAEICARNIRKDLLEFQNIVKKAVNTNTMFFTSVKNKWDEEMQSFFGSAIREILIEKKDNAYVEWRQVVDELLHQTKSYATRPEDCYRFVIGAPIDKGYEMAKSIAGDMRNKNENR